MFSEETLVCCILNFGLRLDKLSSEEYSFTNPPVLDVVLKVVPRTKRWRSSPITIESVAISKVIFEAEPKKRRSSNDAETKSTPAIGPGVVPVVFHEIEYSFQLLIKN